MRAVLLLNRWLMRRLPMVLLFCVVLVSPAQAERPGVVAGNDISLNLKKVYIQMELESGTVKQLFSEVERRTEFRFFYDREVLNGDYSFTIKKYVSLYDLLYEVASTTNLEFRQVNKNINVRSKDSLEPPAQTTPAQMIKVLGKVNSSDIPEGIPFVNILVKGTSTGTVTDLDGNFSVEVPSESSILVFTSVGYESQEIRVGELRVINVTLKPDVQALEEVVVVGFGEQKKASVVSSITSVNVESIKMPSSNFTNSIAGQVSGMIAFQQSGEPGLGTDNTNFFIRGLSTFGSGKRDPLILIDGVESSPLDMARLQADDISDFSVLKDAAASSIYGARGANGVVLINTKMGKQGKTKYSFRVENRLSSNTRNLRLADNITYMRLENEAVTTRFPEELPRYSEFEIRSREQGADPYLFPNNDWINDLISKYTWNQGYNLNISGGTGKGRFYVAGTYNLDNGNLKVDPINNFNNNIKLQNYSIRSNVELELTQTTKLITRIYGQFDDYNGPMGGRIFVPGSTRYLSGGEWIYRHALSSNPVLFPATYPREKLPYVQHPLFGSTEVESNSGLGGGVLYVNPYAQMVRGYQTYKRSNIMPQLELKQELDFITKGLGLRGMSYLRRIAFFQQDRSYNPFYYKPRPGSIDGDGNYDIQVINDGGLGSIGTTGTEYLGFALSDNVQESQFWLQTALDYNRTFGDKHEVGGMVLGYISHYETGVRNNLNLIQSLPNRNAGLSGRFTYGLDSKYLVEFNFGYNGSERFAKLNRFGFFPSGGLGYVISNEAFFDPLKRVVSNMKLRGTYGVVGNDQIGNNDQRFLYLSNVNLNDAAYGASFGEGDGSALYSRPGISISRYANDYITWEESRQLNLGVDLGLLRDRINMIIDVFRQERSNILQNVSYTDQVSGLMAIPQSNYGKVKTEGIDMSLDGNFLLSKNLNVTLRGTFTYATSEVLRVDEITYPEGLSHLSRKGHPINQTWGYIAERLFYDDFEVANSPAQQFNAGTTLPSRAGDIKYRDINGDGIINTDDMVPIGHPTQPEIIYGFGSSFLYKNFDINFYFQGAGRVSFFIDPTAISPFVETNYPDIREVSQNRILEVIAQDHWSESDPDVYSLWPRLSDQYIPANNQTSTWWLRNGSFLRLKRVDIGYNFTGEKIERIGLNGARVYLSGINLLMLSKFNLWDVEMGGNGLGYPIQSVYTLGFTLDF